MKNDKKRFSVYLQDGYVVIDKDELKSVDLNHFSWDFSTIYLQSCPNLCRYNS